MCGISHTSSGTSSGTQWWIRPLQQRDCILSHTRWDRSQIAPRLPVLCILWSVKVTLSTFNPTPIPSPRNHPSSDKWPDFDTWGGIWSQEWEGRYLHSYCWWGGGGASQRDDSVHWSSWDWTGGGAVVGGGFQSHTITLTLCPMGGKRFRHQGSG